MITASIDVTLIDKNRLEDFTRKNGQKAKYLKLVFIPVENDNYGNDYIIKQSVTKEEREAKVEMPILGNGRVLGKGDGKGGSGGCRSSRPASSPKPESDDDVPF